jgi:SAM-dependent methyltransferase
MPYLTAVKNFLRRLGQNRSGELLGCLDAPRPYQYFSGWIDLRGWALSSSGERLAIDVFADGRFLRRLQPDQERPDVAQAYPNMPRSGQSGFETRILATELPGDAPQHVIDVRVVSATRSSLSAQSKDNRLLGRAVMMRETSVLVRHSRGDYKRVWDHEARTAMHARHAVYGTDDQNDYDVSGESTAEDVRVQTDIRNTDTVLEIGCGIGRVGSKLARHCKHWIGADVSAKMLDHARKALQHLENVSFVELNGVDLSGIGNESVDVTYCTGVFMHLDEWDRYRYIQEAFRVLRAGGRIYVDNVDLLSPDGWAMFERVAQHDPLARPPNISKSSTPQELQTYVQRAGFTDVRVRTGSLWVTVIAEKPSSEPATST